MAVIARIPNLEILSLEWMPVRNKDLKVLSEAKKLRGVRVNGTSFKGDGCIATLAALPLRSLVVGDHVRDVSEKSMRPLYQATTLRHLEV